LAPVAEHPLEKIRNHGILLAAKRYKTVFRLFCYFLFFLRVSMEREGEKKAMWCKECEIRLTEIEIKIETKGNIEKHRCLYCQSCKTFFQKKKTHHHHVLAAFQPNYLQMLLP